MPKNLQNAFLFCIFAFENAKLLTLGNWCKHHCSRLIAALHLGNERCGKRADYKRH